MAFGEMWPVVDCHGHVGVGSTCTFIAEEELIPWMDSGGIDVQLIFQVNQGACHRTPDWNPYIGNDYIAKTQGMFPDRVIGLGTVNPWFQPPPTYTYPRERRASRFDRITRNIALEECDRIILELGLRGIKMHPREHGYPVNHWTVRQILDRLLALQHQTGTSLVIVVHGAADSNYNTPEAIGDVAKDYPDLLFLMAHAGFMWGLKTVARAIGPCENVLFDLTTCADSLPELYERFGATRFVAGSDMPFSTPAVKRAIVESIFRNREEQGLVLGGNLAKRLGIAR